LSNLTQQGTATTGNKRDQGTEGNCHNHDNDNCNCNGNGNGNYNDQWIKA
jgi:hypothetical protein